MSKDYDIRSSQELYKAVLALRNSEEADIFFRDILTAKELNEIAERWLIAK
ncbi:MAG: TrpR YerC/YecD, partial [Parcubacteria group bacterium]|nr:TrpR YerC/YecD [Parcubacteria group bacterium]